MLLIKPFILRANHQKAQRMVRDVDQARGVQYGRGKAEEADPKSCLQRSKSAFLWSQSFSSDFKLCFMAHAMRACVWTFDRTILTGSKSFAHKAIPYLLGEELGWHWSLSSVVSKTRGGLERLKSWQSQDKAKDSVPGPQPPLTTGWLLCRNEAPVMLLPWRDQHCLEERLDLKAAVCIPAMLSSLNDCLHISGAFLPVCSVVCPALQCVTAAAAISQLFINSLLYYTNTTLLVCQDLLLFIVGVSAWSTFYRAQMFPFEERDAGCVMWPFPTQSLLTYNWKPDPWETFAALPLCCNFLFCHSSGIWMKTWHGRLHLLLLC